MLQEPGKEHNSKTPLYPFRNRKGEVYNSEAFDKWNSICDFGYTYPELPATLFTQKDQAALKRHATEHINEQYGPKNKVYPLVPDSALIEANQMILRIPGACTGKFFFISFPSFSRRREIKTPPFFL